MKKKTFQVFKTRKKDLPGFQNPEKRPSRFSKPGRS
jgi:hypothetical protein